MLNDSYRLSLEARYYFENGQYRIAYEKAKEAYILDPYNRMAFTVYTQSQIAKEWDNFLDDAHKYFQEIQTLANKENLTDKERQKVKIMLEILLDEYKNLKPSILIGKNLKQKAKIEYEKAKGIYEKVFAKRD
jgi:tetratricopeptide (TPR) repeat protein